jgi:hypothetical protein
MKKNKIKRNINFELIENRIKNNKISYCFFFYISLKRGFSKGEILDLFVFYIWNMVY